jgi:3-dehydroquinate synthetase
MRDDKKNENQHIQFALISAPGQARVDCHGPDHDILDSLHYFNEVARGG